MSDGVMSTGSETSGSRNDSPAPVQQGTTFNFYATLEMAIVLALAFGLPIASSIRDFTFAWPSTQWSTPNLTGIVLYEVFGLLCIAFIFVRHQWKLSDLALQRPEKPLRRGVSLYLAERITRYMIIFIWIIYDVFIMDNDAPTRVGDGKDSVHIAAALLLVLVNPFYEEIIVVGYIFGAMRKAGFSDNQASFLSIVIRMSYHLYQGVAAFVFILPMSLLFTYAYRKWGNVWPLIIAHMLLNARSWLNIPYFSAF